VSASACTVTSARTRFECTRDAAGSSESPARGPPWSQRSASKSSRTAARQYSDVFGAFTSSTVVRFRAKVIPPYCAFQT
jgi:hypothetical protein